MNRIGAAISPPTHQQPVQIENRLFHLKSMLKALFISHINIASLTSDYRVLVLSFSGTWKSYVISKICCAGNSYV